MTHNCSSPHIGLSASLWIDPVSIAAPKNIKGTETPYKVEMPSIYRTPDDGEAKRLSLVIGIPLQLMGIETMLQSDLNSETTQAALFPCFTCPIDADVLRRTGKHDCNWPCRENQCVKW